MNRFWAKVRKSPQCWEWQAVKSSSGHGMFWLDGKMRLAHRVSWEMSKSAIPPGLCVLHRCDNPPCVNPAHLFLGTVGDNNADRASKGRTRNGGRQGVKNQMAKLNPRKVRQIRNHLARGTPQRAIAKLFGVRQGVVCGINLRKYWGHVL